MTDERDPYTFHKLFGHVVHKLYYLKDDTIRRDIQWVKFPTWTNEDNIGRTRQPPLAMKNNRYLNFQIDPHKKCKKRLLRESTSWFRFLHSCQLGH
jgi:hypothetical protein